MKHAKAMQLIHAYHDGELGRWGRWRAEGLLRSSEELREELEALRQLKGLLGEIEAATPESSPADLWPSLSPGLAGIDREAEGAGRGRIPLQLRFGMPLWQPVAGLVAVALVMFALIDFEAPIPDSAGDTGAEVVATGSLRYLKTDGRAFVVSEKSGGATIIWLMDAPLADDPDEA